jgi:hypothetical protein
MTCVFCGAKHGVFDLLGFNSSRQPVSACAIACDEEFLELKTQLVEGKPRTPEQSRQLMQQLEDRLARSPRPVAQT